MSERDLRHLRVAGAAQSSEGYKETWKVLSKQVGTTVDFDEIYLSEQKDTKGIAELRALSSKQ